MPPRPLDDEPETQQLRQTHAPLPGSLDPTRPRPTPGPANESGDTSVLSLDELMDIGAERPSAAPAAPPPVSAPPPVAEPPRVAPTPVAASPAPVRSRVAPPPVVRPTSRETPTRASSGPNLQRRLSSDAAAAWHGLSRRGEEWLRVGDNALALATALIAVLLLVVIAAL